MKIRVYDIQMHYEIIGEGEPLLFIHGLGSSGRDWEPQRSFFAPHFRVITFDARGHGQTDKPPGPYSLSQFVQDTAGLIQALNIAPTHVVGISMGGMIAFQLAVDTPHLLKTMVIVNSGPQLVAQSLTEKLGFAQRWLMMRLFSMRKIGEILAKRMFPKPDQAEIRKQFTERWAENDKRAYLASFQALIGWSVAEHLEEIHVPTLVIAGDEDYSPVAAKEAYVTRIPDARLVVIPDSRHATPVDQPELFNQALLEFLSSHTTVTE
jgi:pimeloyl-ACP methyl ester carboxylesterase